MISPDRATTGKVIANFGRVAKGGDIRIHPLVAGLVEPGALEKLGANKGKGSEMAATIHISFEENVAGVRVESLDSSPERIAAREAYVEAKKREIDREIDDKNRALYLSDQARYDADRAAYRREMIPGMARDFKKRAIPMLPEHFTKKVRFTRGNQTFDYNRFGISKRLKDLIESIEPGVHQFFEFELYRKDGTLIPEPFYFWHIMQAIDVIDWAHSPGLKSVMLPDDSPNVSWTRRSGFAPTRENFAVHKDRIQGRAGWFDVRYNSEPFISDALLNGMREAKMDGYELTSEWSEV